MPPPLSDVAALRAYRNAKLYRPLSRTLRVYNRRVIEGLHRQGFTDFSPAFPALLANLDVEGTRIGVLAKRAGVTRQAAGQLVREIERCGYVERRAASTDARAVVVRFTAKGKRLLQSVLDLVERIEADFAAHLSPAEFERVRVAISRLADAIDPIGPFGVVDEPASKSRKLSGRPAKRRTR